ncbi:hypothetical protein H2201_008203 [Coniosporium apollinis]|uniref:FAD dependent oxidoreductase domain-containing protein n=1 Tax=Coniosporium apollinis TaxID=61459 RepID=A0ABQ9NJD5_9PEZI|nr:hypothetical protein H2201_008203 [Coniosporium apollinis]
MTTQDDKPASLPVPNSTHSFWHSEPNKFLIGHRTTPDLPREADIVVIGSGITGASIARFLAEDDRASGKSIVLLEAREACWGATGRNGGHCQPLLFDRGPEVAAFELRNVAAVRSYIESHDVSCEWRTVTGCRTFWTDALLDAAKAEVSHLRDSAPELAKHVTLITDKAELAKHRVRPSAAGATLTCGAGQLWPYKYVTYILETLVRSGRLALHTNTPVTSLSPAPDGKTTLVHTPRGTIVATHTILATNGYTSHLLPSFVDLIVPVRGEMSAQLPPPGMSRLEDSYGFVGAGGQGANQDDYLIQRPFKGVPNPKGHLMFGGGGGAGTLERVGVSDDSVIDEDSARYLRQSLPKMLELGGEGGEGELKADYQWTGIMGFSRDNMPWVGKVPEGKGVWLCHGMPNGTLCGKAIVDMMLAESEGTNLSTLQEQMVHNGDIPRGYLITDKRIRDARRLPTVAVAEKEGTIGNQSKDFYKMAKSKEEKSSKL